MQYRALGRSGLRVSSLSLGCNAFGARTDEATSVAVVHAALDAGINLIDTADRYSQGKSEEFVGKALADRRSQAVLATKGGGSVGPGPNDTGLSRHHLFDAVDKSLRRLKTDTIDLYQLHFPDSVTPPEETLRALDDLVRWGKIRYIGCSNFPAWQIIRYLWASDQHGWARFIANQPHYSPANRAVEREILPACIAEGVGQIVFFPLEGGLFTGKYHKGYPPPAGSRAAVEARWSTFAYHDANLELVERIRAIAEREELPMAHMVLAWGMQRPGITSLITGASRPEQVLENIRASTITLNPEQIAAIDAASADRV